MRIRRPRGFGPATHIIPLVQAFTRSEGDILEIGTGKFSTDLLSWLCAIYGRKLVSYENNARWLGKLRKKIAAGYSPTSYESFWTAVTGPDVKKIDFKDRMWGVVFVDNDPPEDRCPMVLGLKDKYFFCNPDIHR